jgi:hypothetical protein
MSISYVQASGKDIADLVDKIEDVVDGYTSVHVSIAAIVVSILAQKPDVAPDKLQEAVKGVSEYLAASLFNESPTQAVN